MPRTGQCATQGYSLADAKHTYKAAEKHWVDVEQIGATKVEVKQFGATVVSAERVAIFKQLRARWPRRRRPTIRRR